MNEYTAEIKGQDKETEEILECLKTLLNVRAGTQPADRDFGISWECLDGNPETAETLFLIELEDKVEKYEPRAEVEEVTYEALNEGILKPHIIFRRKERET